MSKLESQARTLLQHHLDTATSEFALSMMAQMPDVYAQPAAVPARSSRGGISALGDDTENVPPQEDAADDGVMQVRLVVCSSMQSGFPHTTGCDWDQQEPGTGDFGSYCILHCLAILEGCQQLVQHTLQEPFAVKLTWFRIRPFEGIDYILCAWCCS